MPRVYNNQRTTSDVLWGWVPH